MLFDKEGHAELAKFTKNYKEKHGNLLNALAREEKKIADEYEAQSEALNKRHRKLAEKLQKQIDIKRNALHRRLEHEIQVEMRLHRRYVTLRSQSTGRLNVSRESERNSVYSLDETSRSRSGEPPNTEPTATDALNHNNSSSDIERTTPRKTISGAVRHRPKWIARKLKKNADRLAGEIESNPELEKPFRRLKNEMNEQLKYASEDARLAMADLEWKCLKERHDLKLDYLEALADFKQRRLTSLGQLKKCQIKGYFNIHRKWLLAQHTREMDARNRMQQDSMRRLATAHAIERQTACRLARTMDKGQRRVSSVLNNVNGKETTWDTDPKAGGSQTTSLTTRPISADTALIDMIFPKTGHSTPEELSVNHARTASTAAAASTPLRLCSTYDVLRPTSSADGESAEVRTQQSSRTLIQSDREADNIATGSLSGTSSKRFGTRSHHSRIYSKSGLRQAKSVQSIQSALESCDQMQRIVINTVSKQQVEQWTDILNQERALTEALMEAHAEQKKALVLEETAALNRARMEHENRAAHLAMVLEATEKFAQREFTEERNRLISHYYGSVDAIPPVSITHMDPAEMDLAQELSTVQLTDLGYSQRMDDSEPQMTTHPASIRYDKCITVSENIQETKSTRGQSSTGHVVIYREDQAVPAARF